MPFVELLDNLALAPRRHATDPVVSKGDDNVFTRTRSLSRAVTEICNSRLQPFGVGAVQFSLLMAIDRFAPATRSAIARHQNLDKSTLTRDLKSIFSEGWVEEVRQGGNGRCRPIALTKAGKQLLLDAESAWCAAQEEVRPLLLQHGFVTVAV